MNSMLVPGAWWPVSMHDRCLRPELQAVRVRGTPVRHVRGVEGRLEQLVLQQHPLVVAEPVVDLLERGRQPVLPLLDVVLTRVVRAVGEPQLQVAGPGRVHDVDTLEQVVRRLPPYPRIGVGDTAQLVVVVLEHVAVDRAEPDALSLRVRRQRRVVVHLVPGDVQRDARSDAGVLVHHRGVGDLLLRRARHTRLAEHLEPGARVPERPRGQLDLLAAQCVLDSVGRHGLSPLSGGRSRAAAGTTRPAASPLLCRLLGE